MEQSFYHHARLNAHKGIGVDIDATLINGPGSLFLQQWVRRHYDVIDLHLITFRTGRDFELIQQDLAEFDISMDLFKGVHGIPVEVAEPFFLLANRVGLRGSKHEPKWVRSLAHAKSSVDEYTMFELAVASWKGMKCKELGLTALIDDLEDLVVPGCEAHGVEWVDSLKLYATK